MTELVTELADFDAIYGRAEGALVALKGLRDLLSEAGDLGAVNREGIFALLGMPIDALEDTLGRMAELAMRSIRPDGDGDGLDPDGSLQRLIHHAKWGFPCPDGANHRDRELYEIFCSAKPNGASQKRRREASVKKQMRPNDGSRKSGNGDAPAA